jgi:hypothetical protein
MTRVANLPPVSTTPAANFATSTGTAGVVDTSGKFAAGVNKTATGIKETGGKYQTAETLK